jgi:hypothetical protein
MIRAIIGHVGAAILREIKTLGPIDDQDREKPILIVEEIRAQDWASLTFIGQRHCFDLRVEGEAGEVAAVLARLDAGLGDANVPLAGHFIAEMRNVSAGLPIAINGGRVAQRFGVEALVLRD